MSLVIELQLFPCINYFKKLVGDENVKIERYEHFKKMSFRNRYMIAGANGIISLSIPLKGGREQKKLITEVEIDDAIGWRTQHWKSIVSSYRKAPFFDYYEEYVKKMLLNREENLFQFNILILKKLFKLLNTNVFIDFTSEYNVNYEQESDLRDQILPKSFQDYHATQAPKYSQVFEEKIGFQPNLSILDLLFCEGPNSASFLR